MADLEARLTHNTIVTLTNDSEHYNFWQDRADKLLDAPGNLARHRRKSFEQGDIALRDAVQSEIADQMRSSYDGRMVALIRHDDDAASDLLSDYIDLVLAHVDWHEVADEFLPETVEA